MRDPRIDRLADVLVNYSVHCRKGEKVLIEARGIDAELVNACIEKVFEAGGYPFAEMVDLRVERALLLGTSKAHCELRAKYPNNPLMHYVEIICLYETGNLDEVTQQANQFLKLIGTDPFYKDIYIMNANWLFFLLYHAHHFHILFQ